MVSDMQWSDGAGDDTLRRRRSAGDLSVEIAREIKGTKPPEVLLGNEVWSDFSLNESNISIDKPTSQLLANLLHEKQESCDVTSQNTIKEEAGGREAGGRPQKKVSNVPAGSRSSSMSPLSVSDSDSDGSTDKDKPNAVLQSRYAELLKREREAQQREEQQQEFLRRLEERERALSEKEQQLQMYVPTGEISPITKQTSPEAASDLSIAWPDNEECEGEADYELDLRLESDAATEHNVTLPPEPAPAAKSPLIDTELPQSQPRQPQSQPQQAQLLHLEQQIIQQVVQQPQPQLNLELQSQPQQEQPQKQRQQEKPQEQPERRQPKQSQFLEQPSAIQKPVANRNLGRARRIKERLADLEGKLAAKTVRNTEHADRLQSARVTKSPTRLSYKPSASRHPCTAAMGSERPARRHSPSPVREAKAPAEADLYPMFLEFMNSLEGKNQGAPAPQRMRAGHGKNDVQCWPPSQLYEEPRSRDSSPVSQNSRHSARWRVSNRHQPASSGGVRPVRVKSVGEERRASQVVTISKQRGRPAAPVSTPRSASTRSQRSRSNSQPSRVPLPLTGSKPAWRPSGSSPSPSTRYSRPTISSSTAAPHSRSPVPIRIGKAKPRGKPFT